MKLFAIWPGLVRARGNTVQHHIDQVVVSYLSIDIKSIDIVQVFLYSTCLFEITDFVKTPVQLVMLAIVFSYNILHLVLSSIPMPISFAPFQCFFFCTQTKIWKSLLIIASLCSSEVIIHLQDLSLKVLYVTT